jgi:hypothetical protein
VTTPTSAQQACSERVSRLSRDLDLARFVRQRAIERLRDAARAELARRDAAESDTAYITPEQP